MSSAARHGRHFSARSMLSSGISGRLRDAVWRRIEKGDRTMPHQIVSREQWLTARKALLAKEKEFTRARERLSEERRSLPWVKVDKDYVFDGPAGKETLSDL